MNRIANSFLALLLYAWLAALLSPLPLHAQEADETAEEEADPDAPPLRLYEEEPYDEIHLTEGSVVKVKPIPYDKPGEIERQKKKGSKLVVVLFEAADDKVKYEVLWADIDHISRFIDLVLAKANQLSADGKFDEAYDYFDWLQMFHADWPGVPDSINAFLLTDAQRKREQKEHAFALAILTELHSRKPDLSGLSDEVGANFEVLIQDDVAREDYRAARNRLRVLAGMYPKHAVGISYQRKIVELARKRVAAAKVEYAAGRLREAYAEGFQAVLIWPTDKSARQLMTEIQEEFPRVIVGVAQPAAQESIGIEMASPLADWAARRGNRLLHRPLLEFTGFGPQGGVYRCPFGKDPEKLDLDMRMILQLNPGVHWSPTEEPLTGRDVARTMLEMASPSSNRYRGNWAALFSSVRVRDVYEVEVEFRRGHVHPEALLDQLLVPWNEAGQSAGAAPRLGGYRIEVRTDDEVRFALQNDYFARGPTQPREIVEKVFADPREAIKALRRGDVQALDRVFPWDVAALKADEQFVTRPYLAPTVHCLAPNLQKPLPSSRTFRRALLYGLNRRQILDKQLLQGPGGKGDEVASGPFVAGESPDDPAGYGRNPTILPRPYQPRLAMTLAAYAVQEAADKQAAMDKAKPEAAGTTVEEPPPVVAEDAEQPKLNVDLKKVEPLILAHPPHELARVACRAIQKQWEVLGLRVNLVETPADSPLLPPPEYDFLYVELSPWEPVTDARKLFGPEGLFGGGSPYLNQALRQLDETSGWKGARERLLEIHRLIYEDSLVLPLWQITDHFVYHKSVANIGQQPVTLYQNIEQWKIAPWFPDE
ncbi:MAG: ABC transporter substrate-binding protein [Pirellulales bacterium]